MPKARSSDLPQQLPYFGASDGAQVGHGVHGKAMRGGVGGAMSVPDLRAPFPWFGGKRRIASLVWERFGEVKNYVEPFYGSGAVLLGRPGGAQGIETVNDLDCYVANFHRALAAWREVDGAPDHPVALDVARWADGAVNEADLHARHRWLVEQVEFRERMRRDPEYFDAKIAGWWVWGLCAWIGSGWCTSDPNEFHENEGKRPELGAGGEGVGRPRHGKGVHSQAMRLPQKRPILGSGHGTRGDYPYHGQGVHSLGMREVHEKLPRLGSGGGDSGPEHGVGVHALGARLPQKLPLIGGTKGTGVHRKGARDVHEKIPSFGGMRAEDAASGGDGSKGVHSKSMRSALYATFEALAERLRYVRVACGDWSRICTDSVTWRHGRTAVFLDPPYSDAVRPKGLYAVDSGEVAAEVLRWCLEHGADQRLAIALCGYAGEHDELQALGWEVIAWKAQGGYGGQRKVGEPNTNAELERLWFSPGCIRPTPRLKAQMELGL